MTTVWKTLPLEIYNNLMMGEEEEEERDNERAVADKTNENILQYLPKRYQEKAGKLLSILKTSQKFRWNSDGVVIFNEIKIPNSHISDLLLLSLRPFKTKHMTIPGVKEFIQTLTELNVPKTLLSSPMIQLINEVGEKSNQSLQSWNTFRSVYALKE